MADDMEEIEALRARVFASEGAMLLLELDAWIGLHSDAKAAWRSKFAKALWSKEDLTYALERGEGLTFEKAREISRADAADYAAVLAEDEAREARARMKRNDEEEAA
jgi:hypothetical protein